MYKRKSSRGRVFSYPSSLPKFPTGGDVKPEEGTKQPIYVNDPNVLKQQPTFTDSLVLYNNAIQVNDFYKKEGYIEQKNNIQPIDFLQLEKLRTQVSLPKSHPEHVDLGQPEKNINYSFNDYYKPINNNQFYQREQEIGFLNLNAPMTMYDSRIIPTSKIRYVSKDLIDSENYLENLQKEESDKFWEIQQSTNGADREMLIKNLQAEYSKKYESYWNGDLEKPDGLYDSATVYSYNPILIKPYSLLTDSEKQEREKIIKEQKISMEKPTQPILYKPWEKLEIEELERNQNSSTPQQENIERVPDVKLPNNNSILKTGFNVKYPSSEFYKPANKETIRDVFQNGGQIDPKTKNPLNFNWANKPTSTNVVPLKPEVIPTYGDYPIIGVGGTGAAIQQSNNNIQPQKYKRGGQIVIDKATKLPKLKYKA